MSRQIKKVPRIQAFLKIKQLLNNPIAVFNKNIEKYGETHIFYLGGSTRGILTTDHEVNQYVLQKNNRNYTKSKVQLDLLAKFLGKGLLTIDGGYWLRQRRLIQPGFHRKKLIGLSHIIQDMIDERIEDFTKLATKDKPIEINKAMMEMAFKGVAKSLFSNDVTEELIDDLTHKIVTLQKFVVRKVRQPYLQWWFKLSGLEKKHIELREGAYQAVLDIINDRRNSGQRKDDLLDMLLESRYEDTNECMTDQQLLYECLILFVAGYETTANALTWTMYLLTQNPEAIQKIRTEIDTVLGERNPEFSDIPQLVYTQQVIKESMRMYPPAWITDRVALEDDEINGIKIPKGTFVNCYIYGAHYSEKYWEQPQKFMPERFTKEKNKARPNFAYFPFGGGPRLCIGNNFAMMEMQMIVIAMIRHFDLELMPGQNIDINPLITLNPKNGIYMRLSKRAVDTIS